MRLAGAEENAIGHDDGGAAAGLQEAEEQRQEEQFGFLGLDDFQEVLGAVFIIERTGEGRIGEDEGVAFGVGGVVLRERILVADVGVFDAVEQHVHAADAEHGVIEIEAVEEAGMEVIAEFGVAEDFGVVVAQILAGGDEEAAGAGGGVANDVLGLGGGEGHHELDDVARGAKLPVLAGAGDFAEHVLVEIAFGVAVVHGDFVEEVDDLGEEAGGGDGEAGILHVVGVGGAIAAEGAEEGEDVFADYGMHFAGFEVFEDGPAVIGVGAVAGVCAFGEGAAFDGFAESGGFGLFEGLEFIEAAEEEEVGDLFDDFEGVGNAARPEGIPDCVYLLFDFAG